ncbi:carbonic anhydrase 3-like [Pollicipes pollicipes]|uniref:carbonic anhydrase 3-like n=1 Tax=Pollicipes pollicipes TaxID=41117 RepID=UPI0018856DAC|nr:carbonic anhydrase 3-like [Pollicipes pollicipes]
MVMPWWLLLIFLKHSSKVTPDSFSYSNADEWKDAFPMCGGPMQSPISLKPNRLTLSRTPKLKFADGLEDGEIEAVNTGREIKLKLRPRNRDEPLVQLISFSKPMVGVYTLAQMHFHWGPEPRSPGSEHAISDKFTDAEAHFVFFNNRYGNFKEAVRHFDGLLVLGVMLHGSDDEQQFMFPTLGMETQLDSISVPGRRLIINSDLNSFRTLLRRAVSKFFSYHGSLTTPPCNPVVSWMVSAKTIPVSNAFLNNVRTKIYEDESKKGLLVKNRRPVQPQLGRVVTQHISIG